MDLQRLLKGGMTPLPMDSLDEEEPQIQPVDQTETATPLEGIHEVYFIPHPEATAEENVQLKPQILQILGQNVKDITLRNKAFRKGSGRF